MSSRRRATSSPEARLPLSPGFPLVAPAAWADAEPCVLWPDCVPRGVPFPSRNRKVASKVRYRRFDKASEAIRFAVEELPEAQLLGAYIEINEARLSHQDIRALYESDAYPLKRAANA